MDRKKKLFLVVFGSALFELKWSTVFYPLRVRTVHPTPMEIFSAMPLPLPSSSSSFVVVVGCRCCCRRCPSRPYMHIYVTCEQGRHRHFVLLMSIDINNACVSPAELRAKQLLESIMYIWFLLIRNISFVFLLSLWLFLFLKQKKTICNKWKINHMIGVFLFLISFRKINVQCANKKVALSLLSRSLSVSLAIPRSISEFNKFFIMPSWWYRRGPIVTIANVFGANKNLLPVLFICSTQKYSLSFREQQEIAYMQSTVYLLLANLDPL